MSGAAVVLPDPERIRADLRLVLRDFESELQQVQLSSAGAVTSSGGGDGGVGAPGVSPYSETEWLAHLELKFVLRAYRMEVLRSLGKVLCGTVSESGIAASQSSASKEALTVIEDILAKIEAQAEARLAATDVSTHPLVLRLAGRYRLTACESDMFQLLFVRGASKAPSDDKEMAMELCGMSVLEVEEFLDDKRTHMVEGIVVGQDDYEGKTIRMTNEAVSVLLLRPMKTEQRLKLSKTELLTVMESSQADSVTDTMTMDAAGILSSTGTENKGSLSDVGEPTLHNMANAETGLPGSRKRKFGEVNDLDDIAAQIDQLDELVRVEMGSQKKHAALVNGGSSEADATNGPEALPTGTTGTAVTAQVDEDPKSFKGELLPYSSSLEYLDDAFQVLALMLRIAKARHKEEMKEAFNDERPWYDAYRTTKVSSIRELRAKLRFVQNRLQERMKLTEDGVKDGVTQLPRLEALAQKLGLDEFEKGVVIMLTAVSISPVVKSIFEAESGDGSYRRSSEAVQVKDILIVYFDSFKEQVLARTYFYKSSRLVARGLIKMRTASYTRGGGDLMDQQVELDRRMLDWIVGLDTEMNELVEGSHLYKPKVAMEQVVLPEEQKEMLLKTVDNFAKFRQYRKREGLEDIMSYGAGLVIMLCGASGTGKTMTVNAVAHHLGEPQYPPYGSEHLDASSLLIICKRVLLVDFHSLHTASGGSSRDDHSSDLRGLFRDADMNDAIIFFDECEAIFAQRERGGDRMLNSLLTEMERHEGIIMLATNRPLDLDEAMHRRITCVSEFHAPDHTQRRKIWQLASVRLPVTESIDWDKIALRYELTGGYIKNALVSALLSAISRDSVNPVMKSFTHRVVPKISMEELILSSAMRERLDAIINFEKARAVLLGQWGFQQQRLGTACLFWGPHGTGKSAAAEAVGFELGRPLKVVNCAQLISRESSSKTGSNITSTFKDSRLMDAVLVLEDFQIFKAEDDGGGSGIGSVSAWSHVAIGMLLHELERFPGICILIANNVQ
ncbi:unnamed protein product, partial [Sphagnum jensenii]